MKGRLITLAAAVSLLLCIATLALWVRSYSAGRGVIYYGLARDHSYVFRIDSARGQLGFEKSTLPAKPFPNPFMGEPGWQYVSIDRHEPVNIRRVSQVMPSSNGWFLGFGFLSVVASPENFSVRGMAIPHWFMTLLFVMLPAIRFRSLLRSRRLRRSVLCPTCGYDLRATPERCPECGGVPAPTPARKDAPRREAPHLVTLAAVAFAARLFSVQQRAAFAAGVFCRRTPLSGYNASSCSARACRPHGMLIGAARQ